MKKILLISIYLQLLILTQVFPLNINSRLLEDEPPSSSSEQEDIDYFNLTVTIFSSLENNCYVDVDRTLKDRLKFELDKKYPWIIDSLGKGINDIGDENECLNSLEDTTFFIMNLYDFNLTLILDKDQKLIDFLGIRNFTWGICVMHSCQQAFYRYFRILAEFINYVVSNNTYKGNDLVQIFENNNIDTNFTAYKENLLREDDLKTKAFKQIITYLIIILIIIKFIGSLFRICLIPKGYDIFAAEKLNKSNSIENNNDIEEKASLSTKPKFNDSLNEESNTKEYNPLFDFSEKLPKGYRILRIFDLINDLHYLSAKRNRYFNDNGLEVITFNKSIVIFSMVFSYTFSALITLPSEEIINSTFFRHWLNIVYRLSNNALICWAFLEGAYTTYKLLCFIQKEMFLYYTENKKEKVKLFKILPIIFAKFLVLLIPKFITLILIYYIFYYRIEDFRFFFPSKATFQHIITNIFKKGIECDSPDNIFFPYFNSTYINVFDYKIDDYNLCYEFIYFYWNMFLSTLLSMIIIYTFFIFRNKIYEFAIIILNLICFFVSILPVEDSKNLKNGKLNFILLKHYHIKGQTYSTKIFQSFFGFYNLGFILGFFIFNMDNLDQRIKRLIYEYNRIHIQKMDNKKDEDKIDTSLTQPLSEGEDTDLSLSHRSGSVSSSDKDSDQDSIDYYKLPYYPLKDFNKFLFSIMQMNLGIKIILIIAGFILMTLIDLILLIYIFKSDSFEIKIDGFPLFVFKYEKHFFMIVYFFMLTIMITLPKGGALRNFLGSEIFILISRLGFILTCACYMATYMAFLFFSIKVKLYVPAFMVISFGNFLLFLIICICLFSIFEMPLRILTKKLLRLKIKKESIII